MVEYEVDYTASGVVERESGQWSVPFTDGVTVTVTPGKTEGALQHFTTYLAGSPSPAVVAVSDGTLDVRVATAAKSRRVRSEEPPKLTEKMRVTLESLDPWSGGIDDGATAGEVEASGGSRSCLYRAAKLGWVRRYGWNQGFYGDRSTDAPRYYLTAEGVAARGR